MSILIPSKHPFVVAGGVNEFENQGMQLGNYLSPEANTALLLKNDGTLLDDSSNGHTWTENGAPKNVENKIVIPYGKYVNFNGGQYLSVPLAESADYHTTGDYTLHFLARFHTVGSTYQTMFCFRNGPSGSNYIWLGLYGTTFQYWQGGANLWNVGAYIKYFDWHLYTIQRESNVMRLFRDGVQHGADSPTLAALPSTVERCCIGGFAGGSGNWLYADVASVEFLHEAEPAADTVAKFEILTGA